MRFLILFLSFSLFAALHAEAANIYEVKNVSATVDVAKGRDQAILDSQNKAFDQLQERLISNKYITQKQKVSAARISTAVDSIDVVEEKPTSKSFKGTYNISFSAYEVSKIFSIQQIAPTKDPQKFLIIPIIAEDDQIKLWKNDWWPIWNDLNHDPIVLPLGDLQDIQNLKVDDLAAHRLSGLTKIAERYSANNIVLLQAQYDENAQSLNVQLEKIKGKVKTVINYEYPGGPNIDLGDLYQAAAEDISYRLQNDKLTAENLTTVLDGAAAAPQAKPVHQGSENMPAETAASQLPEPYSTDAPGVGFLGQKHASAEPPPPVAEIKPATVIEKTPALKAQIVTKPQAKPANLNTSEAVVAAADLETWKRIRGKITAIPNVALKTKSLNDGRAYITISYNTDIETLKKSLAKQGLMAISSGTNLAIKEQ